MGPPIKEKNIMKLITRYDLNSKDINELRGLLKHCFNELIKSNENTFDRTNALASIENIQNEIAYKWRQ